MLGELSRRDELHPFFIIESKNTLLGMRILRKFKNPSAQGLSLPLDFSDHSREITVQLALNMVPY